MALDFTPEPTDFTVHFGATPSDLWEPFYNKYLDVTGLDGKVQLHCINETNHKTGDSNKSAFVDLQTGVYFCSVCGSFSPYQFLRDIVQLPPDQCSELVDSIKSKIATSSHTFYLDHAVKTDSPIYGIEKDVYAANARMREEIPIVQEYIQTRGISLDTLNEWKIGHLPQAEGQQECLIFPYLYKGAIAAIKGRNALGQKGSLANNQLLPFGLQYLEDAKFALVVEGESDTLAAWQALRRFGRLHDGTVAVVGIPGAQNFKSEWKKFFNHLDHIVVIPQIDGAGEMMAGSILEKLGSEKVEIVELPFGFNDTGKDIVDFIRNRSEGDFVDLLPAFEEQDSYVLDFEAIVEKADGAVEWIVPHLIASNEKFIIFGAPKGMKTFVGIHLAKCVAAGLPFLGNHEWTPSPQRVLFVEFEGNVNQFSKRVIKIFNPDDDNLMYYRDNFKVIHKKNVKVDDAESLRRFKKVLEEFKPDLVIFDPLKSLHGYDENDNSEMGHFWDHINKMMRKYPQMSHIYIHHIGKAEKGKKLDLYSARGAGIIAAEVDGGLGLRFKAEDDISEGITLLASLIGREVAGIRGELVIEVNTETFDMEYTGINVEETPASKQRQCTEAIVSILSAEPDEWFGISDLEDEMADFSKAIITKTVKALAKEGQLEQKGKRPILFRYSL